MKVGLEHYLIVSAMLFCIGLFGVVARRSLLVIYMSLELMLNAGNLALVIVALYRKRQSAHVEDLTTMKL
jgi:NADH-quinone oxidoreductase subunit K